MKRQLSFPNQVQSTCLDPIQFLASLFPLEHEFLSIDCFSGQYPETFWQHR
ncbi:MAG: hypothetical protein HC899_16645 [Leptolyngbyaceae cyanobacterium SM1_4_3]|nr:hypothetical protein [Leptolyngbyaceae cyanobacterium SM1_4_3]NJN92261.1 hypothetical protein [Leptolyngbyaceae cyanobacterium SL_5_14]